VLARRDRRSIGIRLDRLHVVVGRPKWRPNPWTSTRATTGPTRFEIFGRAVRRNAKFEQPAGSAGQ
jgi:hypothetical protein